MTFLVLGTLLYFLPSIVGHNKHNAAGIFLLNFFLGWTVIGWVIAMIWACSADPRPPVLVVAGAGRVCGRCGAPGIAGARYCSVCGMPI